MVWWVLLSKIVAGAAKVGKVAGTVGKAVGTAGKAVGGFAKGVYTATAPKIAGGGKLAKGASTASKVGYGTGKAIGAMQTIGAGGAGGAAAAQSEPARTQYTPGEQSQIVPPDSGITQPPQITVEDPALAARNEEARRKKLVDNPEQVISGKTLKGFVTNDPLTLEQGQVTDWLRKSTERQMVAGNTQRMPAGGIHEPGVQQPSIQAPNDTDLGPRDEIQIDPSTRIGKGWSEPGVPESQLREPGFLGKAGSVLLRTATAGAPSGIKDVVGLVDPVSRYESKSGRINEQRDLAWRMADTLYQEDDEKKFERDVKEFLKYPKNVEAFTQRVPGLNDADDVGEFLYKGYEGGGITPSEFMKNLGENTWSTAPSEDSIPIDVQGQTVHLSPESKLWEVIGLDHPPDTEEDPKNMIYHLPISKIDKFDLEKLVGDTVLKAGEILVGPEGEAIHDTMEPKRKEHASFLKQFMKDNPKASETDAAFMWSAFNSGSNPYITTATSGGVVLLNKYTGKQQKVSFDKTTLSNWETQTYYETSIAGKQEAVGYFQVEKHSEPGVEPKRTAITLFSDMQVGEELADEVANDVTSGELAPENYWWGLLPAPLVRLLGGEPTKSSLAMEVARKKGKAKGKKISKPVEKKKKVLKRRGATMSTLAPPETEVTRRVKKLLGDYGEL